MINEIIEVEIESLNINFEGIGFYNGKKVCVRNVLPGERVKVKIVLEKNNFIMAKLQEIITQNPLRIEPPCKYYNNCGGCSLQILEPKDALKLKASVIKNYFDNIFDGEIKFTKSENDFFYRNKIVFSVEKKSVVGLKQENSNKIIKIDKCLIANQVINNLLNIFNNWLQTTTLNFQIDYFVVRQYEGSFIVTIVTKNKVDKKQLDGLVVLFNKNYKNCFGVYVNYNLNNKDIFGTSWQHIYGLTSLNVTVNGIKATIHPYSFLQINYDVMQKLYNKVLSCISKDEIVIECYSGAGLLSAMLAKKAKQVYSIEINKNATNDANLLKQANNIKNLQNINGLCENIIPTLNVDFSKTTFVLDPPQSGCDSKVLNSLIKNKIEKVIYISCNPYTLKQNTYFLKDYYKIEQLEIFDMFPNTSHVECLCVLKRIH